MWGDRLAIGLLVASVAAQATRSTGTPDLVRRIVEFRIEAAPPAGARGERRFELPVTPREVGTWYLYAQSADADLDLTVALPTGEVVSRDDDGGGGTTPFLLLSIEERLDVVVRIGADGDGEVRGILALVEAPETEATLAASARADARRAEAIELVQSGRPEEARELVAHTVRSLLATEGSAGSQAVQNAAYFLGGVSYDLEDFETTRLAWESMLAFREVTHPPDHVNLQRTRGNVGLVLRKLEDWAAARELEETAVASLERTLPATDPELLQARSNLGITLHALGDYAAAARQCEEVLARLEEALPPEDPQVLNARNQLATVLMKRGEYARARGLIEEVFSTRTRTLGPDHPSTLEAGHNLSACLRHVGELERARALQERVLEGFARAFPADSRRVRSARHQLAELLVELGQLDEGRAMLEGLLELKRDLLGDDHPEVQTTRGVLADVLARLGDLEAARGLQEEVLAVRERRLPEGHPSLLATRSDLASNLYRLGDYARARGLQEDVLAAFEASHREGHPNLQVARMNLGMTLRELGELDAARSLLDRAVENLARDFPEDHHLLLDARANLAVVMVSQGEWRGAREQEEVILAAVGDDLPDDDPFVLRVKRNLAIDRLRDGDFEGALELTRDLARGTAARTDALVRPVSARELEEAARRFDGHVGAVLSLLGGAGVREPEPADTALAFETVESVRAAGLSAARLVRVLHGDARARELRDEVARWAREVATRSSSEGEGRRAALLDAVRARDRAERELREHLAADPAGRPLVPSSAATRIAAALAPDEAAVGFWRYRRWSWGETATERGVDQYLAFVLRPGGVLRRVDLGPAAEIEGAIESWRAELGAPVDARGLARAESPARGSDAGRELRRRLWDPLRPHLGDARTAIVALADALHQVPLDALPDGDGVLGDRLALESRATLKELTLAPPAVSSEPSLLALGAIDYDARDATRAPAPRAPATAAGLRGFAFDQELPPLPWTRAETEAVHGFFRESFGEGPAVLETGTEATRESFERHAPDARYIHLATHGWFASAAREPTAPPAGLRGAGGAGDARVGELAPSVLCGLAFAGANAAAREGGAVEGILTAEELAALDLTSCELAVLSACETGAGLRRGGQALASLQQALHAAGVRTTVTSLWPVPDEATKDLMVEFYRRLWTEGRPKARALWEAKQVIRSARAADGSPLHSTRDWAGWVLVGDPD